MLSKRFLTGCFGALAIGLSPIAATAAPFALHAPALSGANESSPLIQVRGGGGGGFGGGGGGFHGGGFHDGGMHGGFGGRAFHTGGGFYGHHAGHGFHGHHRTVFLGSPFYDDYGYGNDCWWSSRRGDWVCPGY